MDVFNLWRDQALGEEPVQTELTYTELVLSTIIKGTRSVPRCRVKAPLDLSVDKSYSWSVRF